MPDGNTSVVELLNEFYLTEINDSAGSIHFFLDWIKNSEQQAVSGNAFYLEKRGLEIILGNLWDDNIQGVAFPKDFFINFLSSKSTT